jgi:hypothetical protein
MDDLAAANTSVEKLSSLEIDTVYPGHGKPFPMDEFLKNCNCSVSLCSVIPSNPTAPRALFSEEETSLPPEMWYAFASSDS